MARAPPAQRGRRAWNARVRSREAPDFRPRRGRASGARAACGSRSTGQCGGAWPPRASSSCCFSSYACWISSRAGGKASGLNADGRGLGPSAAPGADGAPKGLVHAGGILTEERAARASAERGLAGPEPGARLEASGSGARLSDTGDGIFLLGLRAARNRRERVPGHGHVRRAASREHGAARLRRERRSA